jgi:protein-S-isoprenylcysteine O-methyltransferase Ste14
MSDTTSNSPDDKAAVAFHPPVLLLAFIVLGFLARWIVPLAFMPEFWGVFIGVLFVADALPLFAWAVVTMVRSGASVPTNTATDLIVERGPYRFSRNPIYLSMVLLLIGIGFWANSLWFLGFALLAFMLLTRFVILPEEQYLEGKFGEGYLAYKRRVRRWI